MTQAVTLKFDDAYVKITPLPCLGVRFAAMAVTGSTSFPITTADAYRLAAALKDVAARSAPVCDEAEG